ncbi:MAG: nickel-dependent hydrogenase large subunit [Gammaproteobacteria bacterium]|nr:nickel-dependent hydrogenase large subunit [Gammaproteobacteria bacterium]
MSDLKKEINIPIIARVEGDGALDLQIRNKKITQLQLRIYEPPRLFEKFLEGREPNEVIDSVARICGICPVAYQMSAVHAIESIFDMHPDNWVREMRRLFYCGEWMESHGIHIHMLAGPDFFGFSSVLEMAKHHPDIVKRGMKLHALGMALISLLGKRSVHPVGACVGGFFHSPSVSSVKKLLNDFEEHLPLAEALVEWSMTLPFPSHSQDFISVSLQHPDEYPMNEGKITSDHGLNIPISEFEHYFKESQVPYSTALQCQLEGKNYLVGPLARINLNVDLLPTKIKKLISESGFQFPSKNMFHSIIARCIEVYYAMLEAIRIMKNYSYPKSPYTLMTPKAGIGFGCTEAPRGLLWHRFEFSEEGLVKSSKIVPPTSQNQGRIEEDLRYALEQYGLDQPDDILRKYSEKIIRNYDPCISCSTHFLKVKINR